MHSAPKAYIFGHVMLKYVAIYRTHVSTFGDLR